MACLFKGASVSSTSEAVTGALCEGGGGWTREVREGLGVRSGDKPGLR